MGRLRGLGIEASRNTGWDRSWGEPDAFLTTAEGDAWLVKIWPGETLQPRLFDDPTAPPPLEETLRECGDWRDRQGSGATGIPGWIILAPSLDEEASLNLGRGEIVTVLNRRQCAKPERLAESMLAAKNGRRLSPDDLTRWRAAAVSEVAIEAPAHVRRKVERASHQPVAPLLLDYDQERCARLDLEPDGELRQMVDDLQVRVVTGVAGCGKTLVLLHRAALLARHFPKARVLIVSHNRPLIADLERRLRRRDGGSRGIQCQTFMKWLRSVAKPRGDLLPAYETRRWIETRRQSGEFSALGKRSHEWVADEMGWMFDHGHIGDSYLTVERKGRGTGLQDAQRRDMLALARTYRAHLLELGISDWSEWPLSVWERPELLSQGPQFDHLLIDEAQFFAPVWLELLRRCLKPGGHLFLCADPTQGFLRRRLSWSQIGLEVRNRSHRLERPYRSTRAILTFAERFYRRRLPDDDEPLNLPSPEWLESIASGETPLRLPGGSGEDQLQRLSEELETFQRGGGELADVLVLIAGRNLKTAAVVERLNSELGADSVAEVKDENFPESAIGVSHLMAATGLERPVVFLLGIDELAGEEGNPALTDEERLEKIRDHTRQIYVGITRAMERLVVMASARVLREAFGDGEPDL